MVAAWNNKGKSYSILGHNIEAINCYEKALEINSDYDVAWNNRVLPNLILEI